jgi:hypothetical protein
MLIGGDGKGLPHGTRGYDWLSGEDGAGALQADVGESGIAHGPSA